MSLVEIAIPGFSGGEITPELNGRSDIPAQRVGQKSNDGMMISALGSILNQPGTRYISAAETPAEKSRNVRFTFNREQGYFLEFSDLKIRIIKDGVHVETAGAVIEVVTTYALADIYDLDFTQSADTLFITHSSYSPAKLTRTSDTAWVLADTSIKKQPYLAREEDDELVAIQIAHVSGTTWALQATSGIFINYGQGPIKVGFQTPGLPDSITWVRGEFNFWSSSSLIRVDFPDTSATASPAPELMENWSFEQGSAFWHDTSQQADPADGGVVFDIANKLAVIETINGSETAKLEQPILTLPNVVYNIRVEVGTIESTADVNILVGSASGGSQFLNETALTTSDTTYSYNFIPDQELIYVSITNVGSPAGTSSEIKSISVKQANLNVFEWRLPAWSADDYPSKCFIKNQRIYYANSPSFPDTIWGSILGDYEDFDFHSPILATDGFSFKLDSLEINEINWIQGLGAGLIAGTADGEWNITGAGGTALITATSFESKQLSEFGSIALNPLVVGSSILFSPRGAPGIIEITFSTEAGGYVGRDLSLLSTHLFKDRRIVSWAYQRNPNRIIWIVLDNGVLIALTYIKESGIWAMSERHSPLGVGYADVATLPDSNDDRVDEAIFVINRAETGETPNYYIEELEPRIVPEENGYGFTGSSSRDDYRFLESAKRMEFQYTRITGITQAFPPVVTAAGHGLSDGTLVLLTEVEGMTDVNGNEYRVGNQTTNTFELTSKSTGNDWDGTGWGAYTAGGKVTEQVPTITAATAANPVVVTALSHNHTTGDIVRIQKVVGMTELNNNLYQLLVVDANSFSLKTVAGVAIDGTGYSTYLSGGEVREMATTITGLDHLEGETVTALADGEVYSGLVVASNEVTLPNSNTASYATVGIPYTSKFEIMPIESVSKKTFGKMKNISRVWIYFHETAHCEVSVTDVEADYKEVQFDEISTDDPIVLYTGLKEIPITTATPAVEATLFIRNTKPLPLTITAILIEIEINE